jgi:hypothetical protein
MTEHELKCWPEHYAAIDSGAKTCELRLNDRPYQRGDALLLKEWEPIENAYTGRQMRVRVTHVLSGGPWLSPGYVAMSICLMGEDGRARVQEDFRLIADAQRAQLDDAHNALTAAGVPCEPHEPHEGCATQLGHRVRALTDHSDAREALAAYAHEAWSGWKEYEFSKGTLNADGTWTMPAWAVERWTRQMHTPYDALPEAEKDSDRKEADAMLAIVRAALEGAAG